MVFIYSFYTVFHLKVKSFLETFLVQSFSVFKSIFFVYLQFLSLHEKLGFNQTCSCISVENPSVFCEEIIVTQINKTLHSLNTNTDAVNMQRRGEDNRQTCLEA